MNWTLYDKTSCISSKSTTCDKLHQLSLCNRTLKDLGKAVAILTQWDIQFIMCESVASTHKTMMHLNNLDPLVDSRNIIIANPNSFSVSLILQEKTESQQEIPIWNSNRRSKKKKKQLRQQQQHSVNKHKRRKAMYGKPGSCQMFVRIEPGKVVCLSDTTILNWNIFTVSEMSNYMLCIMGGTI